MLLPPNPRISLTISLLFIIWLQCDQPFLSGLDAIDLYMQAQAALGWKTIQQRVLRRASSWRTPSEAGV